MSLNIGLFNPEDEPRIWGSIIADIARHAVVAMMQDDPERSRDALFAAIEAGFAERLQEAATYTGRFVGRKQ